MTSAQEYKNGVGLRGGVDSGVNVGITYKRNIINKAYGELIVSNRNDGVRLTALAERHIVLSKPLGLYGYFGLGLYANHSSNSFVFMTDQEFLDNGGYNAVTGVEYVLPKLPLTIPADLKPDLYFADPENGLFDSDFRVRWTGGLSVRFAF